MYGRKLISLILIVMMMASMAMNPGFADSSNGQADAGTDAADNQGVASSPNELAQEGDNKEELEGMGFKTNQQGRTTPDGKSVDKNQNPFGTKSKTFMQKASVAMYGFGSYGLWELNHDKGYANLLPLSRYNAVFSPDQADWQKLPKVNTSGDLNDDGYDDAVTAVLIPTADKSSFGMDLVIQDHNQGKSIEKRINVIASGLSMDGTKMTLPGGKEYESLEYKKHFRIAACKGKVAVLINRTLYEYSVKRTGVDYTAVQSQSYTFDESNPLAPISNEEIPIMDLKALDVNEDGLNELVLTVGAAKAKKGAWVLVYKWEEGKVPDPNPKHSTLSNISSGTPITQYNMKEQYLMRFASVAMGNFRGKGVELLLGGYTTSAQLTFISLAWDAKTEQLIFKQRSHGDDGINKDRDSVTLPEMRVASLDEPTSGKGPSLFFNNRVYKYIESTNDFCYKFDLDALVRQTYYTSYNGKADRLITYDIIAGQFINGQPTGKEQVYILYQLKSGKYGLMFCYVDEYGEFKCETNLRSKYSGGSSYIDTPESRAKFELKDVTENNGGFSYPTMCTAYVKDKGFSLEFVKASYVMSDPRVIAVLGASPHYAELEDEYGNGYGNAATTYGTTVTKSSEKNGTSDVEISASVGVSIEISSGLIVSQKVAEFKSNFSFENSFTEGWSRGKETSIGNHFSAIDNDMVVLTSTPYDVYEYKITDPGGKNDGKTMFLSIPYKPQTSMMNLDDYNEMADSINQSGQGQGADRVPAGVLNHTVGDPRSYPSSVHEFSGAMNPITGTEFLGVGTGDGFSTQSITKSTSDSSSSTTKYSLGISVESTVGCVSIGYGAKAGYESGISTSVTWSTEMSGTVINLPKNRADYSFAWELAGYSCMLPLSQCYVVNYLVQKKNVVPPAPPKNVKLVKYTGTASELTWSKVPHTKMYCVYRSLTPNVDTKGKAYQIVYATTDNPSFKDTKMALGKQYYYAIVAMDSVKGMPSEALAVPVKIAGIEIKTQPRLGYAEGEMLDLADLTLEFTMTDDRKDEVKYKDFLKKGIRCSVPDGTVLTSDYDGVSLMISNPLNSDTLISDPLRVHTVPTMDLSKYEINTEFTIAGKDHATQLVPDALLVAHTTISNKQTAAQSVMVVVAHYDRKGRMVDVDYLSKSIEAASTAQFDIGNFKLPSDVSGNSVKVFVLEGRDFVSSSLIPIADLVQIR